MSIGDMLADSMAEIKEYMTDRDLQIYNAEKGLCSLQSDILMTIFNLIKRYDSMELDPFKSYCETCKYHRDKIDKLNLDISKKYLDKNPEMEEKELMDFFTPVKTYVLPDNPYKEITAMLEEVIDLIKDREENWTVRQIKKIDIIV